MSIEYFVLAAFIILFLFLGWRGYSKAQKKEISDYGIKYVNIPLNPNLWAFKTPQERNILVNKIIVSVFTFLTVLLHPLFLLFVLSTLLLSIDFFDENENKKKTE